VHASKIVERAKIKVESRCVFMKKYVLPAKVVKKWHIYKFSYNKS
jgi:hypothetical protein